MTMPPDKLPRAWPRLQQSYLFVEEGCEPFMQDLAQLDPTVLARYKAFRTVSHITLVLPVPQDESQPAAHSQIAIISETLTPVPTAMALLSLEHGYQVFAVIAGGPDVDTLAVSRLQNSGAILMSFAQYASEVSVSTLETQELSLD